MRLIKKYESFFDTDLAIVEIGKNFTEDRVRQMLEDEMSEWSDNYGEFGNGEAEEQVIEHMISWYEKSSRKVIDEAQRAGLQDAIRAHFNIL